MKVVDYLINNWINLALVVVGASAFITYLLQNRNEKKSAATKVLLQIDQIEKTVMALKSKRQIDNIAVYKTPVILEHSSWEEYGYQFYGKMGRDDIKLIDDFFSCAAELEKSRAAICHSLTIAWEHKDAELQARIAEISFSKEKIGEDDIASFSPFESCSHIFTPDISIDILLSYINRYRALSGTTAYERLKKISYRK